MLRFATITLSNPAQPQLPPVTAKAVVCGDDFELSIGTGIMEKLQLDQTGINGATELGAGTRLLPYAGPVRVTAGGREASIQAMVGPMGVVIGRLLAARLGLEAEHKKTPPLSLGDAKTLTSDGSRDRIMIKEGVLSAELCRRFCDYAAAQQRERATVVDVSKDQTVDVSSYVDLKSRDTFYIPIKGIEEELKHVFFSALAEHVEPFFGVNIEWWETPQILSYEPGGKYGAHADADRWVPNASGGGHWERNLDRDVSLLFYLNDHFTGGLLNFPDLNFKIQPKPGLLVAFPSSAKYRHGAEPTLTGERLVIVSWTKAVGTPRVRDKVPSVVYMSSMRKEQKL